MNKIRPGDLRIGNWLHETRHIKGDFQVTTIKQNGLKSSNFFLQYDECSGVPILSEWLEKFGFKKTIERSYSFGYQKEYNVYRLNEFTYNGIQAAWWYDGKLLKTQVEFLHQLQNLYFALSGTELLISLD